MVDFHYLLMVNSQKLLRFVVCDNATPESASDGNDTRYGDFGTDYLYGNNNNEWKWRLAA